jgi:DNA (cytosine-5)-methyltransferase 1
VSKPAYYNEIDEYAADWLENLIAAGHIAPGVVDRRSIEDVRPEELREYGQCHFFAGIGVWSYALRRAGWPDDRPIWTGSCPCQPFSSAGNGAGFTDERHLWPAFFHLIQQCHPAVVLGEQVASKDADEWIDLVQTDMEAMGYAFGAVAFPSAGVGAPHIRDRLFWVGNADHEGLEGHAGHGGAARWAGPRRSTAEAGLSGGLADADSERLHRQHAQLQWQDFGRAKQDLLEITRDGEINGRPGPVNGFWRDTDWLLCRDGKWRPVEPGTFPLAHGAPSRVGRLRAYGNAINAEAALAFIDAAVNSGALSAHR